MPDAIRNKLLLTSRPVKFSLLKLGKYINNYINNDNDNDNDNDNNNDYFLMARG